MLMFEILFLNRIVEPCAGQLFIDDVNVLDISLHSLRNNVAIVPQVGYFLSHFIIMHRLQYLQFALCVCV